MLSAFHGVGQSVWPILPQRAVDHYVLCSGFSGRVHRNELSFGGTVLRGRQSPPDRPQGLASVASFRRLVYSPSLTLVVSMSSTEAALLEEIKRLRDTVAELSTELAERSKKVEVESFSSSPFPDFAKRAESPLNKTEVERYGRQLIMSEIGAKGTSAGAFRIGVEECRFCPSTWPSHPLTRPS